MKKPLTITFFVLITCAITLYASLYGAAYLREKHLNEVRRTSIPLTQQQKEAARQAAKAGWVRESEMLTIQRVREMVIRDRDLSDADIDALLPIVNDTPGKRLRNSAVFGIFSDVRHWKKNKSDLVFAKTTHRLDVLKKAGSYDLEGLFLLRTLSALNRPDADTIVDSFATGQDKDLSQLSKKLIARRASRPRGWLR